MIINDDIDVLIQDSALAPDLVADLIRFALRQARLRRLMPDEAMYKTLKSSKDRLAQLTSYLSDRTGRSWSFDEVKAFWAAVVTECDHFSRQPISLESLLRLLLNKPHVCAICRKGPPEVKLEIDHVKPVRRGGSSEYANLQFLCEHHNRIKADRISKEFGNA